MSAGRKTSPAGVLLHSERYREGGDSTFSFLSCSVVVVEGGGGGGGGGGGRGGGGGGRRGEEPKLRFYRVLKTELKKEEYLNWEIPDKYRMVVSRFRCGTHSLQVEVGRWRKAPLEERLCRV